MSKLSKKSVVYFEPSIYQALNIKAAMTKRSISELINEIVLLSLHEDQQDLLAFEERKDVPTLSYEELLEDLEAHGKL